MKKIFFKRNFTLLEMIIAIALIAICFSVISLNISKALYTHKYKNNIKKIDMYFDFCKKMALFNQADVYLHLIQKDQKIYCEMGTDEKMGFFERAKKTKDCFEDIYFLFNQKKVDEIEILFSSTGRTEPKGNIEFIDKKKKFKQIKSV